jgi:hypothetical protein
MAQKELNLLQFTSIYVAKLCTGPPKVMRSEVIELYTLSTVPNHIPDDVLGNPGAPGSSVPTDCPKDSSAGHWCSRQPPINCTLDPDRHRDCADVIALADEIHNSPLPLPNLDVFLSQRR